MLRARGVVLLLFRAMTVKQHDRREKRQPGAVRPALQASLADGRPKDRGFDEPERFVYH